MARVLIVGGGCRGRSLARSLLDRGHAVRATTRSAERCPAIVAAGAEPYVADPDRVGTLVPALEGVAVLCLLLASATGAPDELAALHGERLEMLLQRTIDTTVRGVAYEAVGAIAADVLGDGAATVSSLCGRSRIPFVLLQAEPSNHEQWRGAALSGIARLLATGGQEPLAAPDRAPDGSTGLR